MDDDSTDDAEPTPSPDEPSAGALAAEPATRSRPHPLVALAVVAVVAAVVAVGIWYQSSRTGGDDTTAAPDVTDVAVEPVHEGMEFGTTGGPIVDIYVDYQCIHCADLDLVIGSEVIRLAATGDAQVVIRPVKYLNRASGRAAAALYCAAKGGQAFAMHQHLLADISGDVSADGLTASAGALGLDETTFSSCLTDKATTTWVNGVTEQARTEGIAGIPAVFVDGTRLSDAQLASGPAFRNAVLADSA